MKTPVLWVRRKRSRNQIEAYPTIPEATVPIARVARLPCGSRCTACFNSNKPLAAIAGIDNRNEKRAAVSRVSPAKSPAMIVEPERLEQGISARHWAKQTARE